MRLLLICALLAGSAGLVSAQPPECELPAQGNPVNPTRVCFIVAPDDADITSYVLDLIDGQGNLVQTIDMGRPTPDANGWVVWNNLNVMPVRFGTYTARARSIVGTITSVQSDPSNEWDRSPGPPGGLRVVRLNTDDEERRADGG